MLHQSVFVLSPILCAASAHNSLFCSNSISAQPWQLLSFSFIATSTCISTVSIRYLVKLGVAITVFSIVLAYKHKNQVLGLFGDGCDTYPGGLCICRIDVFSD